MRSIALIFLAAISSTVFGQMQEHGSMKYPGGEIPDKRPLKFAPGIVSLPDESEFGSVFSNDGNEFYYAVDIAGRAEIRFMRRHKDQWTKPVTIISHEIFSYNDPMLSPDETKLFFISDQPLDNSAGKKDYDIWFVTRAGDSWSTPINAGTAVNSANNEYYVSFSGQGALYFSSNRKAGPASGNDYNIYVSIAAGGDGFQTPIALEGSVNTEYYEADVFVARDEGYIIFCGDRPDGYGRGDLYISFRKTDGGWTAAKNMGAVINTSGHELCPFVTSNGKYLFYTSNQDIYWVNARIIDDLR